VSKNSIFDLPASVRIGVLLLAYAVELCASLWLAYELRFDFAVDPQFEEERRFVLIWFIPLQLLLLGLFHQLSPLLGYFSTPDLARMFHALFISGVVGLVVWGGLGPGYAPPRGVMILDFLVCLVGLTGARLALRTYREALIAPSPAKRRGVKHVAVIGAGDAGAVLAHELSLKPGLGLAPVAFFDDDRHKWHSRVHDIPVVGAPERLPAVREKLDIQQAIIAMPSAPAKRVGEIVRLLQQARVQHKTVPSLDQLALGQVRVSQLRNVEVQDLLGREKVELETDNIRVILRDRVVMVTGAGGSIGSELCRQIATYAPRHLLLVDRSEPHLFQIEQELIGLGHGRRIQPLVGDITDRARMSELLHEHRPQILFHAAAHKHVPMMEHQPGEALKNNSLGTAQLAELALEFEVDRFVLISTDKAVNPTSVMGATKRLAEIFVQALNFGNPGRTKFMAVRFGNVLGSSGSVIPVFHRQIAEGGPVKVTHPDMTRYFMTIPEASMLVIQSAMQGAGGEIFVLDMGKPVKILDLARQMIELSGLKPEVDIQIEFAGIRPGEKLFEEINRQGENYAPTTHPKIQRFISQPADLPRVREQLKTLRVSLHRAKAEEIKKLLQAILPEYAPYVPAATPGPTAVTGSKDLDPRPADQGERLQSLGRDARIANPKAS